VISLKHLDLSSDNHLTTYHLNIYLILNRGYVDYYLLNQVSFVLVLPDAYSEMIFVKPVCFLITYIYSTFICLVSMLDIYQFIKLKC
jgi:hypothetical protein